MATRRRVVAVKKHVELRPIIGVEDMVLLPNLSEDGVVSNVALRMESEQIYTNIGHVLVACNPYKWLSIYSDEFVKKYVHQQRVDVAPHIFATAEAAYRAMITEEENQCVIISGESGAGKTEASKQIQNYIAAVCGGGEDVDKIKSIFLESNPVLEAFGNAKTLRNNNSSRFGKYFELKFNRFGCPLGGVVTNYLLEKSRITKPGPGERNFHIFYQLLSSEYAKPLKLGKPASYTYLSCSSCYTVDDVTDKDEMAITLDAMRNVGMTNKQIQSVLKLVAAVLHMGNISFKSHQFDGAEGSVVNQDTGLATFCELTSLDPVAMAKVMTFRELQTMAPGGKIDVYQVPQSPMQAAARRDALAKAIYSSLFDLIVSRINVALDVNNSGNAAYDADSMLSISVLDIYGFEVFKTNGFEQLCINYVNEKLQQIFIELTLRAEQDEYSREGIAWKPIPFFNNKIVCDLLDAPRPSGLFRILDDTCKTMHGTKETLDVDRKFIESCGQVHGSNAHYSSSISGFVIKHYAGDVSYSVGTLGDSNKDALNKDLLLAVKSTSDKLLGHLFSEDVDMNDKKAAPTASSRIRSQCSALVTALMECAPHYIRCIKSNDLKQTLRIDQGRVKHQVKYLGLVENIKVRRAGFAYRAEYHKFLARFGMLSPETYPEWKGADKDGCRAILKAIAQRGQIPGLTKEEAQLGKTKVFVRSPETYFSLERLLEIRRGDFVTVIQRSWRKYVSSKDRVAQSNLMAKLYRQHAKARRRDSIFRPYSGDYLCEVDPSILEAVREGLFRVIDYYDETENIVFADSTCGLVTSSPDNAAAKWDVKPVLVVVTNKALYITTVNVSPARKSRREAPQAKEKDKKTLPAVTLLRRVLLGGKERGSKGKQPVLLQSVSLSKLADESLVIKIQPCPPLPAPFVSHWVPDSTQDVCFKTGQPFTLFNRRHHCRVCANIFVDKACDTLMTVPDFGHYQPVRVCDGCIGVESSSGCEDLVLMSARRTELVSMLQSGYGRLCGRDLAISFQNSVRLDRSGLPPGSTGLSNQPAEEVSVTDAGRAAVYVKGFGVSLSMNGNRLVIASPPGLSHDIVEEKQRQQALRRKRAAEKRRVEDAARAERAAVREEAREKERLRNLAEKKARKAREKDAKKQSTDEAVNKASAAKTGGRQFGGVVQEAPVVKSSAGSELAAKMAARRAAAGGE